MIYLDNNATTIVPRVVIEQMTAWINKGNPSSDYKTAKLIRIMMKSFRKYIAANCHFTSYEPDETKEPSDNRGVYQIIFTSCASESNNTIVRSIAAAYRFNTKTIPHVVVSAIEHKSLLDCAEQLRDLGEIELTIVRPDALGFIQPDDVAAAIKANTCLVSVMYANNETGVINDVRRIGELAHARKVPFHTDAVQSFGKYLLDPIAFNVDAFSVSFHKMHAPPGIGALIVRKQLVDFFHLLPVVCGSQNCGLRGGTENVPGIAAAFEATKYTWVGRAEKNRTLLQNKAKMILMLTTAAAHYRMPVVTYGDYLRGAANDAENAIVIISPATKVYLPNTVFLAVVSRRVEMCNVQIKKALERRNIIISVGSACNTSNKSASHVLYSMGVDDYIKRGALRVSLGDETTLDEVKVFVKEFVDVIAEFLEKK
jgi:cysteine desulfurase